MSSSRPLAVSMMIGMSSPCGGSSGRPHRVELRQHDVEQDEIRRLGQCGVEPLSAVGGGDDVGILAAKLLKARAAGSNRVQ